MNIRDCDAVHAKLGCDVALDHTTLAHEVVDPTGHTNALHQNVGRPILSESTTPVTTVTQSHAGNTHLRRQGLQHVAELIAVVVVACTNALCQNKYKHAHRLSPHLLPLAVV